MVSIVLPTYNGEKYLRESLDSVLDQTFSDWELIVVNDCSTDETAEILDEYAAKDSRIRILTNKTNQRLPRSLNIGFREARGKYLSWTSDDNRYFPEAIEQMVQELESDKHCPMVSADMYFMNADGNIIGSQQYDDYKIWAQDSVGACFLYRREARSEVGGYDPNFVYVEDYAYWLAIRAKMGSIKRLPKSLYAYRVHDASLTKTKEYEVICQRAKLRIKYKKEILEAYKDNPAFRCGIYYDFLRSGDFTNSFLKECGADIPEIRKEEQIFPQEGKFWVFGAGEFGEDALSLLGRRCEGFIDNDPKKIGTIKEGRKVISFDQYQKEHVGENILVAMGTFHIYEVLRQLANAGIEHYFTYARLYALVNKTWTRN